MSIREMAETIVELIDSTTNTYDAVEQVEEYLEQLL
tara:strand:- start:1682 stop:1789 length:108 start_codon:yes stop_codon:yes gene_type:complete